MFYYHPIVELQALIQDVALKGRRSRGGTAGAAAGGGGSGAPDDGGPSLPGRFGSLTTLRGMEGQGASAQEREAALVKLGGGWGEGEQPGASLLGPADPRSDVQQQPPAGSAV